ncbi:hypothetical protein MPTK2_7g08490 [Marchantia polymorpha subsp. ruderalis]
MYVCMYVCMYMYIYILDKTLLYIKLLRLIPVKVINIYNYVCR